MYSPLLLLLLIFFFFWVLVFTTKKNHGGLLSQDQIPGNSTEVFVHVLSGLNPSWPTELSGCRPKLTIGTWPNKPIHEVEWALTESMECDDYHWSDEKLGPKPYCILASLSLSLHILLLRRKITRKLSYQFAGKWRDQDGTATYCTHLEYRYMNLTTLTVGYTIKGSTNCASSFLRCYLLFLGSIHPLYSLYFSYD